MKIIYQHYAWLGAAFVVAVTVLSAALSLTDFGTLRYFNAALLTVTWGAWMADYMESRPLLQRRQRRLRLAFSCVLVSGMYGSLNAALSPDGNPLLRVMLVSIAGGILLVSLLFQPDDDDVIPDEVTYPWEHWIMDRIGH